MASIYNWFEKRDIKSEAVDVKGNQIVTYYYKCKIYIGKMNKEQLNEYKGITANRKTNLNLHTHLAIDCEFHQKAKREHKEAMDKTKRPLTPLNMSDYSTGYSAGTTLGEKDLGENADLFGTAEPTEKSDTLIDLNSMLSYIPCCAHNFQLVLKDGFKLDKIYENLLRKKSKMVS